MIGSSFGKGRLLWLLLRAVVWSVSVTAFLLAAAIYLGIGTRLEAPEWLRLQVESRIEQELNGLEIEFGEIEVVVNRGWRPRVGLRDVSLMHPDGTTLAHLADAEISLAMRPLLRAQVQPKTVALSGLYANLIRESEGIALSFAEGGSPLRQAANLPQLIEEWDQQFELPVLAALVEVTTENLTLRYEDRRLGRVWTMDGGHIKLRRKGNLLSASAGFSLLSGRQDVGNVEASYSSDIGQASAEFGFLFSDIASEDIAVQAPALGWLGVLRAPISGSLRGAIDETGSLLPLSASLQIGEGAIQPASEALPVPIQGASSYFTYFPKAQSLQFDALSLQSGWGSGTIEGRADLAGIEDGQLTDLVGQLRFTDLSLNPGNLYEAPQIFPGVTADFRLQPAPFRFQLGEMLIQHEESNILLSGEITTGPEGWKYALDAQADRVDLAQVNALWPQGASEKPRNWVRDNVFAARAENVNFALRGSGKARPFISLDADFAGAEVRFQKHLPNLRGGAGQFSIYGNRLVISATDGVVTADEGGSVAVAGTSFIIPDMSAKDGTPGIVRVVAQGTVTSALSLLDRPPLKIMEKAKLPVDLAGGKLHLRGTLALPLRAGIDPSEIIYHYQGEVLRVRSDILVPGHVVQADHLDLVGNESFVELAGKGQLSGIPITATWRQQVGKGANPESAVHGIVELSEDTVEALRLGLPRRSVGGSGSAEYRVSLHPEKPPRLSLQSNLEGLILRVSPISWYKSAASKGELKLEATLATPVLVDQFSVVAPGLTARGQISTRENGGLGQARFSHVSVGNWLRAPVTLVGRGGADPEVRVSGGVLDLRHAPFGSESGSSSSGGGSGSAPIILALDRLQVTDSIALTQFRGRFSTLKGFNGKYSGSLNGITPLNGVVVPKPGGAATRIQSEDAGGVFRAAGILRHGRGGSFDMTLLPSAKAGEYDGQIKIRNTRIKDAPSMAALLNAISVVGLLTELGGQGIFFSQVEAKFKLGSTHLIVHESSAVGPAIGLSMDGNYDLRNGALDMRGVVSPIYLVNAIGRVMTRKGEGLFGFSYRLRGTADNPKVGVNPLSGLAPGVFRELFRGRAPRVPGEAPPEPRSKPVAPQGGGER